MGEPKILQTLQLNTLSIIEIHYTEFELADKDIAALRNINSNRIFFAFYGYSLYCDLNKNQFPYTAKLS